MNKLLCWIFWHRLFVLRVLNPGARKVGCERCKQEFGMHDSTRSFVPWDNEFEEFYKPCHEWNKILNQKEAP